MNDTTKNKNLISQTEAARRLFCHRSTVVKYINEGRLRRYSGGKVDEDEIRDFAKNRTTGESPDYYVERARHEQYKADLAQLELKRKSRELIPLDDVNADWARMITAAKTRLLGLPSKVAVRLPNCDDVREMEQIIKASILEALDELSSERYSNRPGGSVGEGDRIMGTAVRPDGESMGK